MAGYGKRPMWQWILLYLVIGGVVYYGIYVYLMKKNGGSYSYTQSPTQQTQQYSY